jgi:hypothetical protein
MNTKFKRGIFMIIYFNWSFKFLTALVLFLISLGFLGYTGLFFFRQYILNSDSQPNKRLWAISGICFFIFLFIMSTENFITDPMDNFKICQRNMKKIGNALEMYHYHHNIYPENIQELIPDYLSEFPTCPGVNPITFMQKPLMKHRVIGKYEESYEVYNSEDPELSRFTIYCNGKNHRKLINKGNYPQYSSIEGDISGIVRKKTRQGPIVID